MADLHDDNTAAVAEYIPVIAHNVAGWPFPFMKGPFMPVASSEPVATAEPGSPFDLDVRIVTGPDAAASLLLGSTDDGCDTQKQGDC
jgi:FxLD family lantipeptide